MRYLWSLKCNLKSILNENLKKKRLSCNKLLKTNDISFNQKVFVILS